MLTPNKRKVLAMARIALEDRRVDFICHALDYVEGRNANLHAECRELKMFVIHALGENYTLTCWQEKNGFSERSDSQYRADRLAWIDWMLDEPFPLY